MIFGDTGCRIKLKKHGDYDTQDCKNGWPYAKIALHAAATNPDLVIHVGDYVYREVPCPAGNTDCSNSFNGTSVGWSGSSRFPSVAAYSRNPRSSRTPALG